MGLMESLQRTAHRHPYGFSTPRSTARKLLAPKSFRTATARRACLSVPDPDAANSGGR